jgi:ADP-ribose pyrophosphatase YjhB (NUDIX family)
MTIYNFCPRCGHTLEERAVDDDHLRPVCPSCDYIVYLNPPIAVGVVATAADGRVVLIRRGENPGRGLWGLPAGFMEIDETTEQTARRECLEETGLEVELEELWGVWSYYHAEKRTSGVLVLYRARITGGEPRYGSDTTEVKFYAPDEIPFGELAFDTHREALEKWQDAARRATD